jgi:hypothetical protein
MQLCNSSSNATTKRHAFEQRETVTSTSKAGWANHDALVDWEVNGYSELEPFMIASHALAVKSQCRCL